MNKKIIDIVSLINIKLLLNRKLQMDSSMNNNNKEHMSVVICGHVDAGKSSTTGRLLFDLGGIPPREMEKMQKLAHEMGKDSFTFAFFLDTTKEERERGITINCTTKEFYTSNYHYTIIDAPGHRDFMKNMISGASQADVGVLMVPADGNFTVSLAKGDKSNNEVKGQTREHARMLNLLGVRQLIVCVNKMDCDVAKYSEERFNEIKAEVVNTLVKVGWTKNFVEESVPILPISGWVGDNIVNKSDKMPWWKGTDVKSMDSSMVHIDTLTDALDKFVKLPKRNLTAPVRMPLSGCFNIKGVGDVITGRIEQGTVKPGDKVVFLPSHTQAMACSGKVFTIEMHHQPVQEAIAGFNVGLNIKGLNKDYKPKIGDVMILESDQTLKTPKKFTCTIQTLDVPNELKVGYCPIIMCRTAKAPCRLAQLLWKKGKETGGAKVDNPSVIKANEMASVVFEVDPKHPIMVDKFDNTESLGRIAVLEGNEAIFLGRVTNVEY